MATHDQHPDHGNKHTPPHEHPQNASGRAGKELSSDQDETKFDQSEENETLEQQKAHLDQKEDKSFHADLPEPSQPKTPETTGIAGLHPSSKDPVDRPIKDENGELI